MYDLDVLPYILDSNFLAWQNPGIAKHLVFMVGTGIVCLLVLFIKEYRLLEKIFNKGKKSIL
jgi:hypothetical protein